MYMNLNLYDDARCDHPDYAKYHTGREFFLTVEYPAGDDTPEERYLDYAFFEGEFANAETFEAFCEQVTRMIRNIHGLGAQITHTKVTQPAISQVWEV